MGKHYKKSSGTGKKTLIMLISLALILTVSAGSTLAFLITKTEEVTNTFTPSRISVEVEEPGWKTDNTVKKNVTIKNEGNIDSYIRIALVMNWQKYNPETQEYEIAPIPVAATDYTMTWHEQSGYNTTDWISETNANGVTYYYHKTAVNPGNSTGKLFDELKPSANANIPEGYTLVVDVLAQGIQAEPASVVADNWGVTVNNNGTITP